MIYEINTRYGGKIKVQPRVELYTMKELITGKDVPGLAICLDEDGNPNKQLCIITKSFGEFIGIKNAAYMDLNNCPYAEEFLRLGIAQDTGFRKPSGYCIYPLWQFKEDFLKEHGAENYKKYSDAYEECAALWRYGDEGTDEDGEEESQEEKQEIGGMKQ